MVGHLENMLHVTVLAVDEDEISKADLMRLLNRIGSSMDEYIQHVYTHGNESKAIMKMNDEIMSRYSHLLHPGLK